GLVAGLRVVDEVTELPGHRSEIGHLPEQPLHRLLAPERIGRQETTCLLGQVPEDGSRLEDRYRLVCHMRRCRRVVHDGRYAVVRTDGGKRRLKLLALTDIDEVGPV